MVIDFHQGLPLTLTLTLTLILTLILTLTLTLTVTLTLTRLRRPDQGSGQAHVREDGLRRGGRSGPGGGEGVAQHGREQKPVEAVITRSTLRVRPAGCATA